MVINIFLTAFQSIQNVQLFYLSSKKIEVLFAYKLPTKLKYTHEKKQSDVS